MKSPYKLPLSLLALLLLLSTTLGCAQLLKLQGSQKPQDKGGTQLAVAVKADGAQLEQSIAQTMSVIQNRCDQLNIYCKLQRQNGDRLILRFSSSLDSQRVKSILLSEGMELREVVSDPSPAPFRRYSTQQEAATASPYNDVMPYLERSEGSGASAGSFVVVKHAPIIAGQDISHAEAVSNTGGAEDYQIVFRLKPEAAERFGRWTSANINNYIAIVLNKKVRSVAFIKSQITDSGEISGRFTKEQAEDTAKILMSGNLPAPLELLEENTYKP